MSKCEKCEAQATQRWQGIDGFVNLCSECVNGWWINQVTQNTVEVGPTAYEELRAKLEKKKK